VNTAARLQAGAPVNGILVGEKTHEATKQAIDFAEAEPVAAKGKTEPVAVWEALQARARAELDKALAFYGSVGATFHIRRGEALRGTRVA
jgi:class 3 adenylate cyclase